MSTAGIVAVLARIEERERCAAAFASGAKAMRQRAIDACASCAADLLGVSDGIDADEAGRLAVEACVAAVGVAPLPVMSINDAPRPVAPAWGPFPTVAEVTAHVAAHPPLRWASPWATGAPWLRLSGNGDLSVIYLAIVDGVVRARFGGLPEWHELEFGRAGMWRPITAHGEATGERDATIAILEAHAAHDATAIAQNVAGIRDARAQVAALTAERDEAQAQLRGAKATIAELLRGAADEKTAREARWSTHLADVDRLTAERDAARAIIAGRATAPTNAEIEAHNRSGGTWYVRRGDRAGVLSIVDETRWVASESGYRWWALDAEGRPCAWPVVEGER